MRQITAEYKKYGDVPKWFARIEIGKKGAIHVHLLLTEIETDIPGITGRKIVTKFWKYGGIHDRPTYEAGGFEGIATYMCKEADKSKDGQANKILMPYTRSRNMEQPEHEVKVYKRWTMRAIYKELEKRLKEQKEKGPKYRGTVIDELTMKKGINPYNGMSYLRFTEVLQQI